MARRCSTASSCRRCGAGSPRRRLAKGLVTASVRAADAGAATPANACVGPTRVRSFLTVVSDSLGTKSASDERGNSRVGGSDGCQRNAVRESAARAVEIRGGRYGAGDGVPCRRPRVARRQQRGARRGPAWVDTWARLVTTKGRTEAPRRRMPYGYHTTQTPEERLT
jgi:hypothetical protein